MISNAMEGKSLPVYGDGKNIRDWLHVYDHCTAIDLVLHKGKIGEVYNIGGHNEKQNLEIVKLILSTLNFHSKGSRFDLSQSSTLFILSIASANLRITFLLKSIEEKSKN